MNQHQPMHHAGMNHNHYGSDPVHGHSSGHMPHSSVSSAASAPSYYAYGQHPGMPTGMQSYPPTMQMPVYGSYINNSMAMNPAVSAAATMAGQMVDQAPTSLPNLPSSDVASATNGADTLDKRPETVYDPTGQKQPPNMKPKVTATLWEDEGSLCFQVEAAGVCVARREDNHMINGTKLLNVAGMTRGRRDGILKSEKTRHVVKIGPMHLKGVWVPFERALDFANKEKITDMLFPLFVHNISSLLYNPANGGHRTAQGQQSSQPPPLQHHNSTSGAMVPHAGQAPPSSGPQNVSGRPEMSRAHTFPTPPTSASTGLMGMGTTNGYDWSATVVSSGPASQALQLETGINSTRGYDSARPYSNHSAHPSFSSSYSGMPRYGQLQSSPVAMRNMGPPSRMHHDSEDTKYSSQAHEHASSEADHDGDYTHSTGGYHHQRNNYGYQSSSQAVSPELTSSPLKGAGRSTPRTTSTYGQYTSQHGQQMSPNNMYAPMHEHRTDSASGDMYGQGYSPFTKGAQLPNSSKKRGLEDEDVSAKRQRTDTHSNVQQRPMIAHKKR